MHRIYMQSIPLYAFWRNLLWVWTTKRMNIWFETHRYQHIQTETPETPETHLTHTWKTRDKQKYRNTVLSLKLKVQKPQNILSHKNLHLVSFMLFITSVWIKYVVVVRDSWNIEILSSQVSLIHLLLFPDIQTPKMILLSTKIHANMTHTSVASSQMTPVSADFSL